MARIISRDHSFRLGVEALFIGIISSVMAFVVDVFLLSPAAFGPADEVDGTHVEMPTSLMSQKRRG